MFKRYWMVHNPTITGGPPNYQHPSKTQARKEAKRMAELNPGTAFAVLEVIDAFLQPVGGAIRLQVSECAPEQIDF